MALTIGLVFVIEGHRIVLSPTEAARRAAKDCETTLKNLQENGLEMELPAGKVVHLGTVGATIQKVLQLFKADMPDVESLPPGVKEVFKNVAQSKVTITELFIKIPGTNKTTEKKTVRLGIYATFPGEIGLPGLDAVKMGLLSQKCD